MTALDSPVAGQPGPPDRPSQPSQPGTRRARFLAHARSPLASSGYALVLGSIATGALGIPYWVLAARLYDAEEVGRAAAVLAALGLITTLASAGFKRGLLRFVPRAGASARALVLRSYAVAVGLSVLGALALVLTAGRWSSELDALRSGAWPLLVVAAAVTWTVFVLQDTVLIAVGRPWLVTAQNVAVSVAKIVVVVALVGLGAAGVLASWLLPAAVAVVVVSIVAFGRELPAMADEHRNGDEHRVGAEHRNGDEAVTVRALLAFTGVEHLATLIWKSAGLLLPIVVLVRLGADSNAYFYVAEQVAYALFLVSSNLGDALVATASRSGGPIRPLLVRSARQVATLVLPGVVVVVALAPQIMGVFGADYRDGAATVLRLLALAAIPNSFTTLVIGVAHVRGRLRPVLGMQAAMGVGTVALAWVLLPGLGIAGIGVAALLAQSVVALGSIPVLRRLLAEDAHVGDLASPRSA